MKASNHFLQCLYISSATAIIICGVLVYTWQYSNGGLSSQKLDINNYTILATTEQSTEFEKSTKQSKNLEQSTKQSTEQSTKQSTEQSTKQSTEHSTEQPTKQSTEQSTKQSTEQSTKQSTEQSIKQTAKEDIPIGDNTCNSMVFSNYAKFHKQDLLEEHNGKFLIYVCNAHMGLCGGYGNRIHGITMSLLFAILSNRTFLIQMSHPFDINQLLHPNAIQWNYTGYRNIKHVTKRDFNLMNSQPLKQNWPPFSKELFNPNTTMITVHTNLGFSYYFNVFDDKWRKLLSDHFNITKDNNILTYGRVLRYLFTYDRVVTDAIKKEMQELGLIPRLFVSVHFRSFLDPLAGSHEHLNPNTSLSRAVGIANNMSMNSSKLFKVYFITDSQEAKEMANTKFKGQILTSHVKQVHVDITKVSVLQGFIGVMVNIEVAAMAAVFVRTVYMKSANSTFSNMIESIALMNKASVIKVK